MRFVLALLVLAVPASAGTVDDLDFLIRSAQSWEAALGVSADDVGTLSQEFAKIREDALAGRSDDTDSAQIRAFVEGASGQMSTQEIHDTVFARVADLRVPIEPDFALAGAAGSLSNLPSRYRTESGAVNKRLNKCLAKLSCRITSSAGISRSAHPDQRCKPNRSAYSCHLVSEAIDIKRASCDMMALRDCLAGFRFRACWGGKGGCKTDSGVLHFGNHEAICFPRIVWEHGTCGGK